MNQKLIKQYIQLAIDNGYNFKDETIFFTRFYPDIFFGKDEGLSINFIELITSKEFIDSVCQYKWDNKKAGWDMKETIDNHIWQQAMAIYNGTLDEFIQNILDTKQ